MSDNSLVVNYIDASIRNAKEIVLEGTLQIEDVKTKISRASGLLFKSLNDE